MPNLDVSDVLLDPDFMTTELLCNRTQVTVKQNGTADTSLQSIPFAGVVTTNSGLKMDRKEDGTLVKGAINIHTQFHLISGDSSTQADEVQWRGKTYIVSQVLSNAHFGQGFVKAICELKPLSG
ncbi:hypothetical protein [Acinetobacter rathckeae]|uniref:hypothetical protein n=1 Tax=Acinetobacter rathckeae TaxID=2605272 RepID=UPI0018A2AF61|nr:hypothetical protein [Acinetobacter rathckeae]MBF7687077.1 hypothetical protein [Acinetobacter rathckeae]